MELAEGGTLRDLLNDRDRLVGLPEAHAVCAGLATLHALGIAHRDVTPQNILRMSDGRLVISDFGLAVAEGENTTFFGGTPLVHASRGQRRRARRSALRRLPTGSRVARDRVWATSRMGREADTESRPSVMRRPQSRRSSATLCAACLHPDPMKRPASAGEVAGWLTAAEHTRPRGRLAAAWRRVGRVLRHRGAQRAVLTMCVLALGVQAGRVGFRPRPCADAGSRVANLWNGNMRDAARRAFARSGKSDAMTAFSTVARLLGEHIDKWTAAYTEACQATHVRHVQSEEVLVCPDRLPARRSRQHQRAGQRPGPGGRDRGRPRGRGGDPPRRSVAVFRRQAAARQRPTARGPDGARKGQAATTAPVRSQRAV